MKNFALVKSLIDFLAAILHFPVCHSDHRVFGARRECHCRVILKLWLEIFRVYCLLSSVAVFNTLITRESFEFLISEYKENVMSCGYNALPLKCYQFGLTFNRK